MNTVGKQIQAPVTCFLGIVLAALLLGLLSVSPVAAQEDPQSTDATLSSLVVVPGGIADFRSNTYAYSVDVANGTTSVLVTPTANDFSAAISVNGTTVENGSGHSVDDLSVGENTIAIVVTAEDGETANTYTVTVRREPALTLITTYSQTEVSEGAGEVTVVYGVVTDGEVRPFKDYGFTLFAEQIDATPGQDFEKVNETISIIASEFALNDSSRYEWSQEVSIRIIDDEINEQDETFRIYTQTGLGLIPPFALPPQETITILDDDEVPGAPGGLVATAGNRMVTLAWTAPSDAGTSPIDGYEYQQKACDGSCGPWLATDHNLGTHHQVSGLTNGIEYTFKVRAISAAGKGEASAEVTATPQSEFRPIITGDSSSPVGTVFLVTISFDRDVPDLPRSALVVHGGKVVEHGQLAGPLMSKPNGREWKAHISQNFGFSGTLTIDIPAGAVKDTGNNPSLAAAQYTRTIKAEHVRPRVFMDLAPKEGSSAYRDPLEPVSGPFTVRIKFVQGQIFAQAATGLTVDEVKITNGTKSDFRQMPFDYGGALGDYQVTVTPVADYTGPFTVVVDEGAAYGCADAHDVNSCDPENLSLGETLTLNVVAAGD